MELSKDFVICGAGIAGVSAAYFLSMRNGVKNVLLIDENPPLSLTSNHSTECYRNWWPGPGNAMVALMNRSVDLMEELALESHNVFHLNRRGYLYLTADSEKIPPMEKNASQISQLGAGVLRIHKGVYDDPNYVPVQSDGYSNLLTGADLILNPDLLHRWFPYVSDQAKAALHVRRAGWLSAQQLGMYLLEQARLHGVEYNQNRMINVTTRRGRVHSVMLEDGTHISTKNLILAAGPFLTQASEMAGIELPVYSERHLKVAINDHLAVVDRDAPMLIWTDPQMLNWDDEEREYLLAEESEHWLLDELPAGVHTRPEGGKDSQIILMLWEYMNEPVVPVFPVPLDERYPEIVLRGLARMLPGMRSYFTRLPRPTIDGGYYIKTRENRPLIGRLPLEGLFLIGALSGFGIMAACGAGELLVAHVLKKPLPAYASAFKLERYQDPVYQRLLDQWGESGQL